MKYTIKNEKLSASFSSLGGELLSLTDNNGIEYIWQGDEKYWDGRSPVLFPYCCRLYRGHYTYRGERFDGDIHGFICRTEFENVKENGDSITFSLTSNEKTKALYPFDFDFSLTYTLLENSLACEITVKNIGREELFYCEGMHPGFNVPLGETRFEDWYLEFSEPASPRRVLFSESKFCCGYEDFTPSLLDGRRLALTHSLFDNEAIFLTDAAPAVSIRSELSEHSVTVEYPNTAVIGFWQPDRTDAPFVCIEPLNGLPSFDGEIDDIEKKLFARHIAPGSAHTDRVIITVS